MARRREDEAEGLTLEAVIEDPLLLLNAGKHPLRALLERRIPRARKGREGKLRAEKVAEEVEKGLRLAAAVRLVFEALDAKPFDREAWGRLCQMVDLASAAYESISPVSAVVPNGIEVDDDEAPFEGELEWTWALQRIDLESPAWDALGDPPNNAWEKLFGLLPVKRGEYLVCPVCGRIQKRGRIDQVYCSGACRASASRRRTDH